jgi:ABC-type uncharacterized transport system auxiliary subunit
MKIPLSIILKRMRLAGSMTSLARRLAVPSACVTLAIGLAGCGGERPIKYYQVSYPTKSTVADDAINTTLMVRVFEASHLYLDNKIVYGFESPEMGTYEYQRWAESPVEIIQNALVRGLRASGRFKAVYTLRADANGRYILGGHLYDFREVDGASVAARLCFEVRLRDRKSGATVWSHTYTYDQPASEKTITAFVEAMDKNVQRGVQEVEAGLEEYFRAHPVQ